MGTTTSPVTFGEFERMPENGKRYELRHGEVIELPPARKAHSLLRKRLYELLTRRLESGFYVDVELGFRPIEGEEYWQADVAAVALERWNAVGLAGNLQGSPDLVAEILSPSNTYGEIAERERLCLAGGAAEFWLVDGKNQTVRIVRANGTFKSYAIGESIPLTSFVEASLEVAQIFEVLK